MHSRIKVLSRRSRGTQNQNAFRLCQPSQPVLSSPCKAAQGRNSRFRSSVSERRVVREGRYDPKVKSPKKIFWPNTRARHGCRTLKPSQKTPSSSSLVMWCSYIEPKLKSASMAARSWLSPTPFGSWKPVLVLVAVDADLKGADRARLLAGVRERGLVDM